MGATTTILFLHVRGQGDKLSAVETALICLGLYATAFFLRWSMWARTVTAGSDMVAHFSRRAGHIVRTGYVATDLGMYTHAPLVHIWIAMNQAVTGLPLFDVRFANVILSSGIPLLVGLVGYAISDRTTGLYAAILTVPFPLVMRIGAMFDSESLALPWFALLLFVLFRSISTRQLEYRLLAVALAVLATYLHFLYPFIMIGTALGALVFGELVKRTKSRRVLSSTELYLPTLGLFAGAIFIFYRMLLTEKGQVMFFSFVIQSSGFDLPDSLVGFFLPTGGAVSRATSTGGGSSGLPEIINTSLNYFPLIIFLILGTIGGMYTIYRVVQRNRRERYSILLLTSVVVSVVTLVALVAFSSRQTFRLAFRFYYFIGIVGLIHCAVALRHVVSFHAVKHIVNSEWAGVTVETVLAIIILGFAVTGPMSTLGNTVDPQFGGQGLAFTETNRYEFQQMDRYTNGSDRVELVGAEEIEMPNDGGPFVPNANQTDREIYISPLSQSCDGDKIWAGYEYALCQSRLSDEK